MSSAVQEILQFWFAEPGSEEALYPQRRKVWFGKDADLDRQISDRFGSLYEQAAAGQLDQWQIAPDSCLALLLLLDQFPRNMFRDTPQSFATDRQALTIAHQAIAQGLDQQVPPIQRFFFYLPLEHSETLADQQRSVDLTKTLVDKAPELQDIYDYALRHQAVIDRFGRFPHRNEILGRVSTVTELEFLQQPGSRF